jgi:hypothetical protein
MISLIPSISFVFHGVAGSCCIAMTEYTITKKSQQGQDYEQHKNSPAYSLYGPARIMQVQRFIHFNGMIYLLNAVMHSEVFKLLIKCLHNKPGRGIWQNKRLRAQAIRKVGVIKARNLVGVAVTVLYLFIEAGSYSDIYKQNKSQRKHSPILIKLTV